MLPSRLTCRRIARFLAGASGVLLLAGCKTSDYMVLFPAGAPGDQERNLIIVAFFLLLFVFVPVTVLTLWFAWRYRSNNERSTYTPRWEHSRILEMFLWGGPIVIIVILGTLTWYSTHALDPYKQLESKYDTLHVQAIAMDWKWLFVYPDQNVATVDQMTIPKNRPVSVELTSDTVMTAFMVPALGTQIFAMSGMRTNVHLMSKETGTFFGKNYQYNGKGFHEMDFEVNAIKPDQFQGWVSKVRSQGSRLDAARFAKLTQPSEHSGVIYFSPVKNNMLAYVVGLYHNGKPRNKITKTAAGNVGVGAHATSE